MPIYASESSSGKTFSPAPEGVHQAVCCDVIDLGMKDVTWQGKTKSVPKVEIRWQLGEDDEYGKRFRVHAWYTNSLNEKANLRRDLESWRGRAFTEAELEKFDLEVLLGKNCLLNLIHNKKGDKTYANVSSIMPTMKNSVDLKVEGYTRAKDYVEPEEESADDDSTPF